MAIQIEHLNYIYSEGTAFQRQALTDICLTIPNGQFLGIIGHTGSGKSTLVQHLNGLLKATSGKILMDGKDICGQGFDLRSLRSQVGLVFQYPEYQLFEVNVITDVQFGPKNLGLSQEEVMERAVNALEMVGIGNDCYEKSPFELSGGQKRRVAIAGILAMRPKVLVLDEPTAGLDPKGRQEILELVSHLHKEQGCTVILVSHSMEDVADYVERILVIDHGTILYDDTPAEVFSHVKELEAAGLAVPQVNYVMEELRKRGWPVQAGATTIPEAARQILECVRRDGSL